MAYQSPNGRPGTPAAPAKPCPWQRPTVIARDTQAACSTCPKRARWQCEVAR